MNNKTKRNTNPDTQQRPVSNGHFAVISQVEVPRGRRGKHKDIVARILDDLASLKDGNAMRIRLDELPDTKEKVRAALGRAVHLKGIEIVTSTDEDHLYIWHAPAK